MLAVMGVNEKSLRQRFSKTNSPNMKSKQPFLLHRKNIRRSHPSESERDPGNILFSCEA
jgi:hypothetical protein